MLDHAAVRGYGTDWISKVVRYSFPQSEAIHTQIALKLKNEYFFT